MLRCLVLEDEPLAMKQIESYISQTPFLSLEASVPTAVEAMNIISQIRPDLVFVDINMPEINGIDFVKSLRNPPLIVFTTAYSEYAIEGFRVDAVDYLLKPIGYSDFLKAANKAKLQYEQQNATSNVDSENNEYLFIRSNSRFVKIKFSEIKYIEGMREYIRLHLADGASMMTLLSMKSVEDRLPQKQFMRVHRSYIINLNEIREVRKQRAVLTGGVEIMIGAQYKDDFDKFINKDILR